jgi:polysaccharide export outer membrane protein
MGLFDFRRFTSRGISLLIAMALSGCASLPSSGPTGNEIKRSAAQLSQSLGIELVQLGTIEQLPPSDVAVLPNLGTYPAPPTDMVGPGDVLDVAIYEAGVTLFAGSSPNAAAQLSGGFDPSAKVERLPPNRVDDDGYIRLPYIGRLKVMGKTTSEIEAMVRKGMRGMSQDPQILISIRESISNSVILGGEVARPGRLVLPTNQESLLDAVALAGGYRGEAKDLIVRVQRAGRQIEMRLGSIFDAKEADFRVYPGDRIILVKSPRTFSVMGAPGRVEHFTFGGSSVSLAEALAMAGGTNPSTGDAKAIFVFRYAKATDGVERPTVYHLNMTNAGSFFLAQRFPMQDKDILYVGNAGANQPTKLVQIISQLFAPVVAVSSLANAVGN